MTPKPILTASGLRRTAAGRILLDGASVEVRPGDQIGLSGPSGSGKSVFLRSLAMLEPIDDGTLLHRGARIDPSRATSFRSDVIYLPQRPASFEGSVESVLRLPFGFRVHQKRAFDRAWTLQQLSRIGRDEAFLDQLHARLSGGEAQIVAVLQAMQLGPSVMLFDEPTAATDQHLTYQIEKLIDYWLREANCERALVWVSHDPSQLTRMATRRLSMINGRVSDSEIG